MREKTFPIDMVYSWCDGNDPVFKNKVQQYAKKENLTNSPASTGDIRFFDNDELKYSLRSLEMNAPWINHIYIVTDNQIPEWMNCSNPKITIIDHTEIIPRNLLPVFNSTVIEQYIGLILGLSEHFLYGNDDTFFGKPTSPDFFFKNGKPIIRFYRVNPKHLKNASTDIWKKSLLNAWNVLYDHYGHCDFLETHHNIDAYTVSEFKNIFSRFEKQIKLSQTRFRSNKDIQRTLFNQSFVYDGMGSIRIIKKIHSWRIRLIPLKSVQTDSIFGADTPSGLSKIEKINPTLFCINSTSSGSFAENKRATHEFMERHFPNPSSFEK